MCDGHCMNSPWNSFYHQYLQQHAQMMQWVQRVHSNVPPTGQSHGGCCHHEQSCQAGWSHMQHTQTQYDQMQYQDYQTYAQEEVYQAGYYEEEENAGYSFSVNPVVNKENIEEESDESFECIDSTEEFEYLELNPFGKLEKRQTKVRVEPTVEQDVKQEQEEMKTLYGDEADKIMGLETNMALKFENLCDIHQPHLWPVLPLRL